jgi:hypothetical protein
MSKKITTEQRLIRMEEKLDKLLAPTINIYVRGNMDPKETSRVFQAELQRVLKDKPAR